MPKKPPGVVAMRQLKGPFLLLLTSRLWYNTKLNWGYYTFCLNGALVSLTFASTPA